MSRDRENGFTLIELLITVGLLGVVTLALGNALSSFLTNTDATTRRLTESHDAQISAAYFAQDVASIGLRNATTNVLQQSVATAGTDLACGTIGSPVVRLAWDDPTTTSVSAQVRVAYVVETVDTERQLHRLTCNGSGVVKTDNVVVHDVAATAPVITCVPAPCSGSGAGLPQLVTMVLSIKDPKNPGPEYRVTLAGSRRQTS